MNKSMGYGGETIPSAISINVDNWIDNHSPLAWNIFDTKYPEKYSFLLITPTSSSPDTSPFIPQTLPPS